VALPKDLENTDPKFYHYGADELPQWQDGSTSFKLIAGKGYGKTSPVPVHSPLFMLEIKTIEDYILDTSNELSGEIGICIVKGSILACDNEIKSGNILVSKVCDVCKIEVKANSHLLLFGGEPFDEEPHIYWNFVSHSKRTVEAARESWKNRTFPMMKTDKTYVPLPD
jgi:redox-sensitive bicupin YhaK (pirin superfamily)